MIFWLICACYSVSYQVKGTKLLINGPGNVTKQDVLDNCDLISIDTVIVQEGTTGLEYLAFEQMQKLSTITIGPDVNYVNASAFRYIYTIISIDVDPANKYFVADSFGALYTKDMTTLIKVPTLVTNYKIPRSVNIIVDEAIHGLQLMNSISLHNNLTSIGFRAFWYPKNLNTFTFEPNMKIDDLACFEYTQIKSCIVPKNVKLIKNGCFWRCYFLTSLTFEKGSKLICVETSAFGYCNNLPSIVIPEGCKELQNSIFSYDVKLKSISLPASLEKMTTLTFSSATEITQISLDENNQNFTLTDNVLLTTADGSSTIYIVTSITSLTISATMKTIGVSVLQGCENLTSITVQPGNPSYYAENGILYNKQKTRAVAGVGGIVTANI